MSLRLHVSCLAALCLPAALASTIANAQEAPKPAAEAGVAAPKGKLIPAEVDPSKDMTALEKQGDQVPPGQKGVLGSSGTTYAEDWWTHTRPIFEIHGFFRTRAELFHNFSLGRIDLGTDKAGLFPRPLDDSYLDRGGNPQGGAKSTPGNSIAGCGPTADPKQAACYQKTNASANMRFRIDPEIHISDNLRIMTQIDMLDNLVLGSTPEGYTNTPSKEGGYASTGRGGYVPLTGFSSTQVPPVAGVNSWSNSVAVKRIWGEFVTPIGQIRFGRMPSHWGLGILANAGNGIDSDYQSNADRIMFITGSKQRDLYVAAAWDFPNSGRTSDYGSIPYQQGQPYNTTQLANTAQWVLALFRRVNPQLAAQKLAKGETVFNGGFYGVYRQQILANESVSYNGLTTQGENYQKGLVRVGLKAFIPDLWFQVLTKNLRWETEAVYITGSIENPQGVATSTYNKEDWKIRQLGIASELEYRALNGDLKLRFYTGFASGDQGVEGLTPGDGGLQPRPTSDRTVSTFRFHPDYRVDLILWRNILTRVQGAYYFRPGVEYDFTKTLEGEKFGGRADIVWSRASKAVQTPGHKEDLGIELDLSLYYQSKDGSLNDDPSKIGGFFAMLQYGVLFPLGGLGYQANQTDSTNNLKVPDISTAQIVRLFMGIAY